MDYDHGPDIQPPSVSPYSQKGSTPPALTSRSPSVSSAANYGSAGQGSAGAPPRIRRRNRMITSCLECRRRKLKCNKSHPCTNCVKSSRDCVFLAPALDQASQLKLTEIKEKVGSLERLLERDVAKTSNQQHGVTIPDQERALPDDSEDYLPANDDEHGLEPTPLATLDAAYDLDGDDDDLLDMGIMLGKMRLTERLGGFFRPRISEELEYTMSDSKGSPSLSRDDGQTTSTANSSTLPPASEWLKPGPSYITPSNGFFFGGNNTTTSLIDFLPSRLAADRLIKQYFDCVHPICQILHRPTFEKEYDAFWEDVTLGVEPPNSVQTIVFAAMFSGVVSMEESTITRDFGITKTGLLENFKLGTETALSRANFLRTTKIEVLQGFVMYLLPLCRAEVSRAHSVLVGAAIRMAECMGLHRDGETYGMSPYETHIRRLVWHQICFLDIRTCEAQGPRPTIRRDEFDTKLPVNANDIEFHTSGKPPAVADRWTDATLCLIRFEVNEMMRTIWTDRPRIESRKISLTAVLSKIETFRSKMAAKYDHLMDERVPIQKAAKIIKALTISRLHIMVLHRYHASVASPMPDRLRSIMVTSGTVTLEMAIQLETLPELKPWSWYIGALTQYHTAFLLLMEVYVNPQRQKEEARIWACLDYVFDCDPNEPYLVKGKKILGEIQQKTAIYQSMRGMRAPLQMEKRLGMRAPKVTDSSYRSENLKYISTPNSSEGLSIGAPLNSPPLNKEAAAWVGKVPIPQVQFAGVSNGESLWAIPNQKSPESGTDAASRAGSISRDGTDSTAYILSGNTQVAPLGLGMGMSAVAGGQQQDDLMADIDWDAFDALFPPEQSADMASSAFQPLPAPTQGGSYF